MAGEFAADPRGLIREAYAMQLGSADCRTIFLDWALGSGDVTATRRDDIRALLDHYGPAHPDHPMTAVLRAGLETAAPAGRRGGARGRHRG